MVHSLFWQTVVFVEDNYSIDHRGGEWFQDDSHLLCTLFLLLLHQLHLRSSGLRFRRLGHVGVLSRLSCSTLCDPKGCSGPGSSVHVILQSRILEWVAMPSSGSSQPRSPALQADSLPAELPGKTYLPLPSPFPLQDSSFH